MGRQRTGKIWVSGVTGMKRGKEFLSELWSCAWLEERPCGEMEENGSLGIAIYWLLALFNHLIFGGSQFLPSIRWASLDASYENGVSYCK